MSIALLFKMAAVGILVTIFVGLGGLILILTWLVPYISALFDTVEALFQL